MKILIFSNLFPLPWEPRRGLFNAQMAAHLAEHHTVRVCVPVPWTVWRQQSAADRQPYQIGQVSVLPFPYFYIPGTMRWSYGLTMAIAARRLAAQLGPWQAEVMLATWLYPDAIAGSALAKKLNIPVVLKAHGSDVNLHGRFAARRWQIIQAARQAHCTMTVSDDLGQQLRSWGLNAAQLRTIYNGVDPQRFFPQPSASACAQLGVAPVAGRLLYVGNLKVSKGVVDLLAALAQLPPESWQHCVIIGEGADRLLVERLVAQYQLTDKIALLGSQSPESINLWLAASTLLVLPSHAEGVPNVVLEAMAAGRPVVASRLPGISEVVTEDCAVLVAPQQPAQLAAGLLAALARDWHPAVIVEQARRFSWSRNREQLEQILTQAIAAYTAIEEQH